MHLIRLAQDENNMSRRVAGNLQYLEKKTDNLNRMPLLQQHLRRRTGDVDAGQATKVRHWVAEHDRVARADEEWRGGERFLHRGIARNVIDVAMRVEDHGQREVVGLQFLQNFVRLEARIDDDRVSTPPPPENVG